MDPRWVKKIAARNGRRGRSPAYVDHVLEAGGTRSADTETSRTCMPPPPLLEAIARDDHTWWTW